MASRRSRGVIVRPYPSIQVGGSGKFFHRFDRHCVQIVYRKVVIQSRHRGQFVSSSYIFGHLQWHYIARRSRVRHSFGRQDSLLADIRFTNLWVSVKVVATGRQWHVKRHPGGEDKQDGAGTRLPHFPLVRSFDTDNDIVRRERSLPAVYGGLFSYYHRRCATVDSYRRSNAGLLLRYLGLLA